VSRLTDLFSKRSLDDRLLSGELSQDSGEGRVRAEQLLSADHRAKCAKALRDLVEEAWRPHASFTQANLLVPRRVIRDNQELILTLARELEELAVVNPRGVILSDRLIQDGASPAYALEDHGELVGAVERARAALKGN
jgi:hypothetical protein